MGRINLNELAALKMVLEFINVKDLLSSAMNSFAENEDIKSKDNANVCFEAISVFLK